MKNKNIILFALAYSLIAAIAMATEPKNSIPYASHPGFLEPDTEGEISVKDLLVNGQDNMRVVLKGHIIKRLSHDEYIFTDSTAEVVVEIDSKNMPPEQITPETLVKLYGKVDKDYFPSRIEIEVKYIEVQKLPSPEPK